MEERIHALIATLGDPEYFTRRMTVDALVQIGTPAVEWLCRALDRAHPERSIGAAQALAQIGDARAVDPLITALDYPGVQTAAAEALGQLKDTRAVEPLLQALERSDSSLYRAAALALGHIGDARAVPALLANLRSRDERLAVPAADALALIGAPAVEALAGLLQKGPIAALLDSSRRDRSAAAVLARIGVPAREALCAAVTADDPVTCFDAAYALHLLGDSVGVERLCAVLANGERYDTTFRADAAEVLGAFGDARAIEALCRALGDGAGGMSNCVIRALRALASQKGGLPRCVLAEARMTPSAHLSALRALHEHRLAPPVHQVLDQLRADADPDVATAARNALAADTLVRSSKRDDEAERRTLLRPASDQGIDVAPDRLVRPAE